ncbi:hypothetical protein [Nocardia callitridis]|uniref:Cupin n=1 Tax=Nocardia callitridis TaxID=648753 RepID=A0ABP9K8A7_9NOCA
MRSFEARSFTADRPWGALDITEMDTATVRPHWTDHPYVRHVNDGPEVFVVLDGAVDVHYREHGEQRVERLVPGRIRYAEVGDEHVAYPGARGANSSHRTPNTERLRLGSTREDREHHCGDGVSRPTIARGAIGSWQWLHAKYGTVS